MSRGKAELCVPIDEVSGLGCSCHRDDPGQRETRSSGIPPGWLAPEDTHVSQGGPQLFRCNFPAAQFCQPHSSLTLNMSHFHLPHGATIPMTETISMDSRLQLAPLFLLTFLHFHHLTQRVTDLPKSCLCNSYLYAQAEIRKPSVTSLCSSDLPCKCHAQAKINVYFALPQGNVAKPT